MPVAHATKKALATPPAPQPQWTERLLEWKVDSLRRVREQLAHVCCGPQAHPKSFALLDTVRNVVAQQTDPEGTLGLHLQDLLMGAIAQEIAQREDLMPKFLARFPGAGKLPPSFIRKYVNSRWWCQSLCELETTRCADVTGAVESAIRRTQQEMH